MSKLSFGTIERYSVQLNTATVLGLKLAHEDFAKAGQGLPNVEICIEDRRASMADPEPDDAVITDAFPVKLIPRMRGLGNANRLGKSIEYAISPETGEVLGVFGMK
ncbi:hypothetical protein [Burkholderia arboris]|uniref:hypothetical protein n=1 Tax=Burkholderia arboris TaxID=488730 RepID=UPI00210DFCCF|nr:hypothetical protein [Burkholderia arboris]UTV54817.1 hypothetical protein NLX30_00100 [Burkholderia arboris]